MNALPTQGATYVLLEYATTKDQASLHPRTHCQFRLVGPNGLQHHSTTLEDDFDFGGSSPVHGITWAIGQIEDGSTLTLATNRRTLASKTPEEREASGYTVGSTKSRKAACARDLWEAIDRRLCAKRITLTARKPEGLESFWQLTSPENFWQVQVEAKRGERGTWP